MCVTSLLCGPWADLWPFDGLYSKWYSKRFAVPDKEKRLGVEEKATAGNSFRVMKSWGMTYLTGWTKSWLRAGCNVGSISAVSRVGSFSRTAAGNRA